MALKEERVIATESLTKYKGKTVFVTGHTGFKGSWLVFLLNKLGARVYALSDQEPIDSRHSYFALEIERAIENKGESFGDVRDGGLVDSLILNAKPDFVFHLAAQALVLKSFEEPVETITTNVLGTLNVLDSVRRNASHATTIMITSDKCYANDGREGAYLESDRLGGDDPYSASKAAAEIIIHSYMSSYAEHFVGGLASVRAGNVFGGGDWSRNRLVPDAVSRFINHERLELRMPGATRPWTWVIDILLGYLALGSKLSNREVESGTSWNFASGESLTVLDVATTLAQKFSAVDAIYLGQASVSEAVLLQIDATKSRQFLGWEPVSSVANSLASTADWYLEQSLGTNMLQYSSAKIQSLLNQI